MRDANGIFVKVYLYALHLACQGKSVENAEIAKALNILESDVMQAFTHWQACGAIVAQGTHEELMKSCEIYRDIYKAQQEGVSIGG